MEELIQTPYGMVRLRSLEALQSSFDTALLKTVDDIDRFSIEWKQELRDDMLRVHAMAHTVINEAPLSCPPGDETLGEMAASIAEELQDYVKILRSVIGLLKQIASLAPE